MNCLQLGGNTPISKLSTETSVERLQPTVQRKFPGQIAIVSPLEKIQSGHSHPKNHCVELSNSKTFWGEVWRRNNGIHLLVSCYFLSVPTLSCSDGLVKVALRT